MRKGDGVAEGEVAETKMSVKSATEITIRTSKRGMTFFFSVICFMVQPFFV